MATNEIPTNTGELIVLGNNMLTGLISLGTTLGITQVTPDDLQTALDGFTNCQSSFGELRGAKQTASTSWRAAMKALDAWLGVTRNVLAGRLGNRWSPLWAQAGFGATTTAVPDRVDDRLTLAASLADFFTAHPSYEVAGMLVTAARATTLRTAAMTAMQTLATAEVALKTEGDGRATARTLLVTVMRTLIGILKVTLTRNDPRWLTFGLQMPATNTTPGQPQDVTVGVDPMSGSLVLGCDALALATRFRWRMLLVGSQTKYALVGRSVAPLVMIDPVPVGQVVQIVVQGVNGASQGVASVPVLFTMPGPVSAVEAKPAKGAAGSHHENGGRNGNGHGNGVHSRVA